jgi:putative Holliday junction resolvase
MRILAIDYGTRRLGLALSDPMGITAQPLASLQRKSIRADIEKLREIVVERQVGRAVIGLPLNLDGSHGALWEETNLFRTRLETELGIPVAGWDERLSTVEAERVLISADISRRKRKGVIDKVAASIILQSYLEAHPQTSGGNEQ